MLFRNLAMVQVGVSVENASTPAEVSLLVCRQWCLCPFALTVILFLSLALETIESSE